MTRAEKFWIEYAVESIDCQYSGNDSNAEYEVFMAHAIVGTVKLGSIDKSISVTSCGLLALSRSLIRLCIFPAMYGVEAFETILDTDVDLTSTYQDGFVELDVHRGIRSQLRIEVSLADAMGAVGRFHKALLLELFGACPQVRQHPLLLVRVPDAFALAQIL